MIHFILFFSNENGTDNMTEKHRGGGAGRGCLNTIQQVNTVWWGSGRGEGQARVPNGVKDIVSKISIFFHIYIYIGLIILF